MALTRDGVVSNERIERNRPSNYTYRSVSGRVWEKCSFRGWIKHALNFAKSFRVPDDSEAASIPCSESSSSINIPALSDRQTSVPLLFPFVWPSKGRVSHFLCPVSPASVLLLRSSPRSIDRLVRLYVATRARLYRRPTFPSQVPPRSVGFARRTDTDVGVSFAARATSGAHLVARVSCLPVNNARADTVRIIIRCLTTRRLLP